MFALEIAFKMSEKKAVLAPYPAANPRQPGIGGEEDEAAILFHSCKWQCKRPATKTAGSGKASIETSAETSPPETLST